MGEVIVITSGKGGVGKTTTTANIGIGLAKLGKKVIVIDTDLGLRNLDVVLGLNLLLLSRPRKFLPFGMPTALSDFWKRRVFAKQIF